MLCTGLVTNESPSFRLLSETQLHAIHDASMRILGQTGVRVFSEEAVSLLRDAGAHVHDGTLVLIPEHLVDWAVHTAPRNVTIYDRNGEEAMLLGRRRTYFGTGSDTPNVIDPRSGERRRAVLADVADFARVGDGLSNIDFLMCMGIASDKDRATAELHHFAAMLRNSTKPLIYTALDLAAARRLLDMAGTVRGGIDAFRERPFALMYVEPVSPLGFAPDVVDKLLLCAENRIPCIFMSGMLAGGTGPITPAGGLALANAESLAGLLIAQLKREGTPVICGGGVIGMDMHSAISSYSAPEFMLSMGACAEMAQSYGLPAWGYAGCTDAKTFDEQAAADTAEWIMMAALCGSNLVHDVGFLESGMTSSFELLVFADEIIGKCSHILSGITVDGETLAVDVANAVGPGGCFLSHPHTKRHCRSQWTPNLEDRTTFSGWCKQGSLRMGDRVREEVHELLDTHWPAALDPECDQLLTRIIEEAEATAR